MVLIAQEQTADDNDDHPCARKTKLGWGIIGGTSPPMESTVVVYITVAQEVEIRDERKVNFLVVPTKTKELISPSQVREMLELDFNDKGSADTPLSYEDKMFIKKR